MKNHSPFPQARSHTPCLIPWGRQQRKQETSISLANVNTILTNKIIIIIIYHDFLPPLGRCSLVKSDNTRTIINIYPLAHILEICDMIFSSCARFKIYPDRNNNNNNDLLKKYGNTKNQHIKGLMVWHSKSPQCILIAVIYHHYQISGDQMGIMVSG